MIELSLKLFLFSLTKQSFSRSDTLQKNSPCHQRESEKYDSFLESLDNSSLIDDQFSCLVNLMGQVSRKEIKWIVNILSI